MKHYTRLGDNLLYVDIVKTSEGNIRIGTMPEVAKVLAKSKVVDQFIVVPTRAVVSQAGDNRIGEEFVMWNAILKDHIPKHYIGEEKVLEHFRDILNITQCGWFSEDGSEVIQKDWLDEYFIRNPVADGEFRKNDVRIVMNNGNVQVYDGGKRVYDFDQMKPDVNIRQEIDRIVDAVPHDTRQRNALEVLVVGSGNGFGGKTSSFVIMYGNRKIWIDPSARPYEALGQLGVNWDDITDYFISHNHTDHIEGFSASLQRKIDKGQKMSLLTTRQIYETLKRQFGDVFKDMDRHIELTEIDPAKALEFHDATIETRYNHHLLRAGTLGLKIYYKGRCLGISGDTKYSRELSEKLKDPKLAAEWFADCDLLLHEADFKNDYPVHTDYRDLSGLEKVVKGKMLVYHAVSDNPMMAKEGAVYKV